MYYKINIPKAFCYFFFWVFIFQTCN